MAALKRSRTLSNTFSTISTEGSLSWLVPGWPEEDPFPFLLQEGDTAETSEERVFTRDAIFRVENVPQEILLARAGLDKLADCRKN